MARPAGEARERALGAAVAILCREGSAALTMDKVARESGVSKGGVLHHFSTKDGLILEVVRKATLAWEAAVESHVETDPEPTGRYVRAFMTALSEPAMTEIGRGLLAAVALNPDLLEPMRELVNRCHKRILADGLDPATAYQCILVADALWYQAIFNLPPPAEEILATLKERLFALTRR